MGYGWICHLCSYVNHCNYSNPATRLQKYPWYCNNPGCGHTHPVPPPNTPLPYSNGCDQCDEIITVPPPGLFGVKSYKRDIKLIDGKMAQKQIGWACSWCAKLLDFDGAEGRSRKTRTCPQCGLRKENEWYRVVKILHVAKQEEAVETEVIEIEEDEDEDEEDKEEDEQDEEEDADEDFEEEYAGHDSE